MGLLNYVNRFPEISHLSQLEQWKLLQTAHGRLFGSWKTFLTIFAGAALMVLGCIGLGVGVAAATGWSRLAGGLASTLFMLAVIFHYERIYARRLQRTVREMVAEPQT